MNKRSLSIKNQILILTLIPLCSLIISNLLYTDWIENRISTEFIRYYRAAIFILLSGSVLFYCYKSYRNIYSSIEYVQKQLSTIWIGTPVDRSDIELSKELGEMSDKIDLVGIEYRSVLSKSRSIIQSYNITIKQLRDLSVRCTNEFQSQQQQLEQLVSAMTQMSATVTEIASNAGFAANHTQEVSHKANVTSVTMKKMEAGTRSDAEHIQSSNHFIEQLHNGVLQINEMTNIIDSISEQTNLLALNAAIEAARAGEQGRGFSVVADEVRNLAGRTQDATKRIQTTIKTLNYNAKSSQDAMQVVGQNVDNAVAAINAQMLAMGHISDDIHQANDMVTQIATAAEEQSLVTEEINSNVENISRSMSGINDSMETLNCQSETLSNESEHFLEELDRRDV
ncbi:methyl-accepting chemotaxis protein [Vibrio sp. DW001]|uniref:methyl-accepting chemotaxis protein n=1 Tax=Vibrio sp. DW001 TaxID=2912315 RepID=UPI0023B18569|nr:methyl-accepting chemotaxis protein [Vibrio sp. DW001]WED25260.1 methyl-accepting chemotaxis protein [Vibrio sp. DW001]